MESIIITSTDKKRLREIICNAMEKNGYKLIVSDSDGYLAFGEKETNIEDRIKKLESDLIEHINHS